VTDDEFNRIGDDRAAAVRLGVRRREELTRHWRAPDPSAPIARGPGPQAEDERPDSMPTPDETVDRQIDEALELLRTVPFEELQRRGWHLQPNHFYWPLNDLAFLRKHARLWLRPTIPAEVDWNLDSQVSLLSKISAYVHELAGVPMGPPAEPGEFVWDNPSFPRGDASAYHGIIRHLQPRRVVEIGAGWSSLVLRRALTANVRGCDVTLIDPQPLDHVLGELQPGWTRLHAPVQLVDLTLFEGMSADDVVFYDGTHCVRTASDVNWVFFEVLPRLAPGVWIHIHDMGWPYDYPPKWVLDEGLSWNEQYFVQAFLVGNQLYSVRLAVSLLWTLRRSEVEALIPWRMPGGSLWIEKLG
jgi:hypothetical protein